MGGGGRGAGGRVGGLHQRDFFLYPVDFRAFESYQYLLTVALMVGGL